MDIEKTSVGAATHDTAGAQTPDQAAVATGEWARVLIEHAPDAIVVYNYKTGRFIDVNANASSLFAMTRAELLERGPLDLSPPVQPCGRPSTDVAVEHIESALAGNVPSFEWIHCNKSGEHIPCEVRLVRLPTPGGAIIRASITDISQRKETERALRKAADRLEDAQRIAKIGCWELDLVRNHLYWSDEIFRIFELDPEKFGATYEKFLETVHPDDRATVDGTYKRSLETKTSYAIVHRLLLPDGRIKWVRENCETAFDAGGRPLMSRGTVQDITRQRQIEDELHSSQERLAAFLRASPEAVIVTDDQARIAVFNAGAEAVFGYPASEIIGRTVDCLMPERARERHHHHVTAFRDQSENLGLMMSERGEIVGLRKSGEEFPATASLSKLTTPTGTFFAMILRDVTKEKAARDELLRAKLDAESANEAKSRFIANMSHELRTPLNAIIGFSQLLAQDEVVDDGARVREFAEEIHKGGKALLDIINDVLQISRLDLGAVQLHEDEVTAGEILETCLRSTAVRADEGGIAILVDIAPGLPSLWVDRRLLEQVLLNLLTNAIKFTDRGGRVVVTAKGADDGGVEIAIRDTGVGMRDEDIARIGKPFEQADNKLARRYEGAGLGLATSRQLVELHGGQLLIESRLGEGTTVTIRLPKRCVCAPSGAGGVLSSSHG